MMNNPLFNLLNKNQFSQFGNMGSLIQQFNQFRNNFKGDPQQIVQQMLNSGQLSQEQFNQVSQLATQFQRMISK